MGWRRFYLEFNLWENFKENTVYSNYGGYGCLEYAEEFTYKIYEFEDVIFEENINENINNKMMNYHRDKIGFNNILKSIIKMQEDTNQPIYVIAKYWLGEFQGIEDIITRDGNNDLEELKRIFIDKYASDCHVFKATETIYKILKIDISEVQNK